MIKKNIKLLIITSIIIILPMLVGVILWNKLPDKIPTHWNSKGEVDQYSSKAFTLFGLTGILLAVQWLCAIATSFDPKKQNHPTKILHLVFWIIPVLSVVLYTITYLTAMGLDAKMEILLPIIVGLILAIVGNYLPKCKQNYTIGIKIPWTLNSEENWNRTHRFAGKLWVIGGVLIMLSGLLQNAFIWVFIPAIILMVFAPLTYSFILYKKGI